MKKQTPKVRLVRPTARPFQLRYYCPESKREVRISTGGRNEDETQQLKSELEAKLLLGIETKPKQRLVFGPKMAWDDFREQYTTLKLGGLRDKSANDSETRLDVAERIIKPRTLGDLANRDALETLQTKLLAGAESNRNKPKGKGKAKPARIRPRSPHTVKSYMVSVIAALNWAERKGWLASVPRIEKIKTSKLKAMKGRPITLEEFERMLAKVPEVVGDDAAESWEHVLRGLWESALRIGELMDLHWTDRNRICPEWPKRRFPILHIPSDMQKNDTEESIPLLPGFEAMLLQTAKAHRFGWAFNPESLQTNLGRTVQHDRRSSKWVGIVISRIGKAAGVVVSQADESKDRPAKFASAHDLRRSCLERLRDEGVPREIIRRVARHASSVTTERFYTPGEVQKEAAKLRELLVPGYSFETI